jgi:geranylgeranyl pyrophosphate synthase
MRLPDQVSLLRAIFMAFASMLSSRLDPTALVESCQVLAWAAGIRGMVGGQMDDLLEENRSHAGFCLVRKLGTKL